MRTFEAAVSLFILGLVFGSNWTFAVAQGAAPTTHVDALWPMFHQNAQHTGLSPFSGPSVPFLKWRFQTRGPINSSPAIGNGRIYVTDADGNLYALNLQGDLIWTFRTGQRFFYPSSPAIGSDGTVYLGSYKECDNYSLCPQGILYAINPAGHLKWNLTLYNEGETATLTSPTIGSDGTIYVSQVGYHVIAVHPDGTLKWSVGTNGWVLDSPAVAPDGTVYVGIDDPDPTGACGQCLMAINPDGTIKWTIGYTRIVDSSPTVGLDGTVYAGAATGLFAFNPDGTIKWQYSHVSGCTSPSIGPDGTVYCSGYFDTFHSQAIAAFDRNGNPRWELLGGQTSAAIGSNGLVYFGVNAAQGNLRDVNPNGTSVWNFTTGPITGSDSLAMGLGGTLYVGSADGSVYAID